jgi:hypothetical protein
MLGIVRCQEVLLPHGITLIRGNAASLIELASPVGVGVFPCYGPALGSLSPGAK